jgi:hypothetical protein
MKLIEASCENNIVKAVGKDGQELYEIPHIIVLANGRGKSQGFVICEGDKWFYISGLIDILNLLELTMRAVNQTITSVTNSMCPQAPSGILPLQTTIGADMEPILEEFRKLKEDLV